MYRKKWYNTVMNKVAKKKNRRKNKIDKQRLIIVLSAILLVLAIFIWVKAYRYINTYDGLGGTKEYPKMEYSSEGFYRDEYNFLNYNYNGIKAKRGIDVSVHQGEIDWASVKKSGVEFAYIRLGFSSYADGKIYMDDYFEKNVEEAQENGIDVGVYFFSQAVTTEEAVKEAKYVLSNIKGRNVSLPIGFDMEPVTENDRIKALTVEQKTEVADAFGCIMKKHGRETLIYGNPDWIANNIDLTLLTDYEIWLAHYTSMSSFEYDYAMWQYSSTGRVDGINTNVDLNIMFVK